MLLRLGLGRAKVCELNGRSASHAVCVVSSIASLAQPGNRSARISAGLSESRACAYRDSGRLSLVPWARRLLRKVEIHDHPNGPWLMELDIEDFDALRRYLNQYASLGEPVSFEKLKGGVSNRVVKVTWAD